MRLKLIIAILIVGFSAKAQEILTPEDAAAIALENNYDIRVAKAENEQAKNNAGILNSGYLPSVSVQGNANTNTSANDVTFNDGRELSLESATTNSYGAQANVNYVIFDGFGRYFNYKSLKERYNLSELQVRQLIENTLVQVFAQYYQVALLEERLASAEESLAISQKRYSRAQSRTEYGQNTGLELLNAEVDLNNDSVNYMTLSQQLADARRNLNLTLGRDVNTPILTSTMAETDLNLTLEEAVALAQEKNAALELAQKSVQISELSLKASRSGGLPKLSLNAGYNYNFTDYGFNPNLQNLASNGPQAGLTLSWSLFDGGRTRTTVKNAQLSAQAQRINAEKAEQNVIRQLNNAFTQYETALYVAQTRERSLETNQRNFARTKELFERGQITSVEFRQAQLNLFNAQNSYYEAKFNAKNAELQLKQLTGTVLE